ncbi:MAG: response regulator, partial [bacterium]|nr:response regulator [bacterium]
MQILIVEDDAKMGMYLKKGLEEEGCSVVVANDGEQGLQMALASDFDVVVLDVMLPILEGFEVARRRRQRRHEVPILMLTARDAIPEIIA